ncbi:unnamed protein product, partial [marine sediment metagenome]
HVDLMKMNIEGGEIRVFRSMTKALPKKIIMSHHFDIPEVPGTKEELLNLLHKKGYKTEEKGWFIYGELCDPTI